MLYEFSLSFVWVLTVTLSPSVGDDNGDLKIDELEEGETTPQEKAKKQQQQQQQQHKIIVEGWIYVLCLIHSLGK